MNQIEYLMKKVELLTEAVKLLMEIKVGDSSVPPNKDEEFYSLITECEYIDSTYIINQKRMRVDL